MRINTKLTLITLIMVAAFSSIALATLQNGLLVYYPFDEAAENLLVQPHGHQMKVKLKVQQDSMAVKVLSLTTTEQIISTDLKPFLFLSG